MTCKLSLATLNEARKTAAVPAYSRSDLSAGIVHFGVGNFHRAHQAVYLDDLFNTGADHDFAIIGAGVLPSDAVMREKLAAQDFLTTVVEQDNNRTGARVTGPMIDILPVGDSKAIIDKLADPKIRIVSMTITEGGYFIDASGSFNPQHPAIAEDGRNPASPKTVFGLIVAGLKARRDKGLQPFTVMSCDNIPHNGKVTKNAVVGLAALSDPAFANWIGENVAFRIPWSTALRPRQASANAILPATISASKTTGRSSARSSSNGLWRIISLRVARRSKRRACSSSRMSRLMST